jgi:hypothetical protein
LTLLGTAKLNGVVEISTQVQPSAHGVLNCDGAGWHQRGKKLKVPADVWHYLPANKLSLLVWDSYEAIVAACKSAWDFLISDQ